MLQIYIDGEELEIPRQDIAIENINFRFSSPIADAWTNDFEIPLTERNRRLLKIYGVLDRNGALSRQVRCTVAVNDTMFDGYMQVTAVREHTADVTAYMGDFPFEILDKRLTDILKDDGRTILQHGTYAEDTALTAFDAHYWRFDAGNYDSTQGYHHPSVSVNHLLSRINGAAGTNIADIVDESLHIVSSRRMVCPDNPRQVLYWRTDGVAQGGKAPVVQGGQHIVDDYNDAGGESSVTEVTINRKCSASVTFKARTRQAQNVTVSVMTSRGIISLLNIAGGGTVQETVVGSFAFEAGDVIRALVAGFTGSADIIALFEFSDYAITDDDYGIDMDYVSQSYTSGGVEYGERHPVFIEWTHGGSTLNPIVVTEWAYMYFGAMCNLPDISVRDLLSGLVWVTGKKIVRQGNSVEWGNATDGAVIEAEITEIRPSSEKLGKVSKIGYKGELSPFAVRISNDFIEAEKILHESTFVAIYTDRWSWATIPLYSTEAERSESGATEYTSRFDGIDGAVIAVLADFPLISKKGLVPPPRLATMGFAEITSAVEVEGRTFSVLSGLDYVFVDGRKYMLVSSTLDCATGLTDFVAVETRKLLEYDDIGYFRITNISQNSGAITITNRSGSAVNTLDLKYSYDLETWTEIDNTSASQSIDYNAGQSVYFKGVNGNGLYGSGYRANISSDVAHSAGGSILSLIYGDDYGANNAIVGSNCFNSFFYGDTNLVSADGIFDRISSVSSNGCQYMFRGCTALTTAPSLPATSVAVSCYESMFRGCTSLTTGPALPATSLAASCYSSMFYGCTSLTSAPSLPATSLANFCYSSMFQGCTALTEAPALPATSLANYCYSGMFYGCTSLTAAPAQPATTLAQSCYQNMFYGCTSLTTAPALPATSLADGCYSGMFYGCTSLTAAPALPAVALRSTCYSSMFYGCTALNDVSVMAASWNSNYCLNWMYGVAANGTFTKLADTLIPLGASGIPYGWTVIEIRS